MVGKDGALLCSETKELGTKNELEGDESYAHITLFQPISQCVAYKKEPIYGELTFGPGF